MVEHTITLRLWPGTVEDLWGLIGFEHYMPKAPAKGIGLGIYSTAFPEADPCGAVVLSKNGGNGEEGVRIDRIAVYEEYRGNHIFTRVVQMLGAWVSSLTYFKKKTKQRVPMYLRISAKPDSDAVQILHRIKTFKYIGPSGRGSNVKKKEDEPDCDNFQYVGHEDTEKIVVNMFATTAEMKEHMGLKGGASKHQAEDWGELTSEVSYCVKHGDRLTFHNNNLGCYCEKCDEEDKEEPSPAKRARTEEGGGVRYSPRSRKTPRGRRRQRRK